MQISICHTGMNRNQLLLLLLLMFTIGMLSSVISLRDSYTAPKIDPFCSPPPHLLDQWSMKEWKVFGIPRVAAGENFFHVDPRSHNMRDYKFSECRSYGYQVLPMDIINNYSYTVDTSSNQTCVNGYSFEDPGSSVSFIAEFELLCDEEWLFPTGHMVKSILVTACVIMFAAASKSPSTRHVIARKILEFEWLLPLLIVSHLVVHISNTLWVNEYVTFVALEGISLGVVSITATTLLMSIHGDLLFLSHDQALVLLIAFSSGWYTSSIASFSLIEVCKSWRTLSIISSAAPASLLLLISVLIRDQISPTEYWGFFVQKSHRSSIRRSHVIIRMSRDRCEDVYSRCEEQMTHSVITSVINPHHRVVSSIGSASTLINRSPCSIGNSPFSFDTSHQRASFCKEMSQCVLLSCMGTFVYRLSYYLKQERSCFTSQSTYWCLTSTPITELVTLLVFLMLHTRPQGSFSNGSTISLSATAVLAITSTFMTINRILEKSESSGAITPMKDDFQESNVDLIQSLTSTLIISSTFLMTHTGIRISGLVIRRKSLPLALVSFVTSQMVAAAIPAAAYRMNKSYILMACLAWVPPVTLILAEFVDWAFD